MTRDTQRLHEPDINNDAETYAALWDLSPFPRLPDHAPFEIKSLTVDILDPKRVYAIHRAARRQQFHLLVERYVNQIRYGCQSNTCTTTTCFSCRRRLAGGAPVRRYNATSARTLAVFLASQDNPEQGLCHNMRLGRPGLSRHTSKSKRVTIGEPKAIGKSQERPTIDGDDGTGPKAGIAYQSNSAQSVNGVKIESWKSARKSGYAEDLFRSRVQVLDEPTKMDHKSFVQNVFGTVAFKMVEWLTPSSLHRLSLPETFTPDSKTPNSTLPRESPAFEGIPHNVPGGPMEKKMEDTVEKKGVLELKSQSPDAEKENGIIGPVKSDQSPSKIKSKSKVDNGQPLETVSKSTPEEKLAPKRKSSHVRTSSEPLDHHKSKSILNLPQKPPETDPSHFAQYKAPRQKVVRQAVLTSPSIRMAESPSPTEIQPKITVVETEPISNPIMVENSHGPDETTIGSRQSKRDQTNVEQMNTKSISPKMQGNLPQSLSCLSVEVIQIICQIMQSNRTSENHTLSPQAVSKELISELTVGGIILPESLDRLLSPALDSQTLRLQWQQFIEQSLFDVISHPASLMQSFRQEDKSLDTQTIWYLMLRLTRVAPALLFDSLWRASKFLFETPAMFDNSDDWRQKSLGGSSRPLSDRDAAQVISLCLHALVASVPLIRDSRKLANMSRIRSYGLATLGRDSTSLEPVALCLQYDDAFTNENAMRLARRLFAAIPTRQAFAELDDYQMDIKDVSRLDILDTILASLKLDPEFTSEASSPKRSGLKFSNRENDLHEHRMYVLVLDWARTVMLQDWQGSAVVPRDGPFGGALMTMAAMYKNRKSLLLGDIHFQTQYFSSRLDPITMPREWTSFVPNKKTVHLLDHPYLFTPTTLVTYFRAINFSNMNLAYETAKAVYGLMNTARAGNHELFNIRNDRNWGKLERGMSTATTQFLMLDIRRTHVLMDTFNQIWRREERELMRPLKLRLGEDGGEEGLDSGGVQQEFFGLAIAEALNPDFGTFTVDDRTKMTWFQPGSPEPLWKFELIGTIVSLAVYNGITLPVTFPKALYRKLLDQEVTELHHIEDGWPDLASGLTTLLEWNESDGTVEDVFSRTYEFSISQFGQAISREMGTSTTWPQFSTANPDPSSSNPDDAPLVTNENRNNYVSDYIRWLTDISVQPQFEAFKRGFFTCLSPRTLTIFDPITLQSIIEGIQEIDIAELRRITRYVGWDASHHTIRDFWSVVKRYDHDQKKKLLEFITASDRVPVGGMKNLQFTLQKNGVDDGHLPTSYTCFGILLLPEFSSREVLREKMGMALENSRGFGFA